MIVAPIVDIVIAIERIGALAPPLTMVLKQVDAVREAAPELEPELAAIEARISEAVEHVLAAQRVLSAKVDLMGEDA